MMTSQQFRRMALRLPEASEGSHMGHPDFRVEGKIFATLDYPEKGWGMVKLTPELQQRFVQGDPKAFVPVKGAWGRRGCTNVRLGATTGQQIKAALDAAWCNVTVRGLKKKPRSASSTGKV